MDQYHTREIMKRLARTEFSGQRPHEIFRDWLALVEACLKALPGQALAAMNGEEYEHVDDEETQALFAKMRETYKHPDIWEEFAACLGLLIDSTTDEAGHRVWCDVLGDVYMNYAYPNPGTGQYFTPWDVCTMMAQMQIPDGERQVHDRVKKALLYNDSVDGILGQAMVLATVIIDEPAEAEDYFFEKLLPQALAIGVEPVTVMDPCVGSGRFLLAAAAQFPPWAIQHGLVKFYGQDIDHICVSMCKVNMMLYGL